METPVKELADINVETNKYYCKIVSTKDAGKELCDLTRQYLVYSFRGNNYFFVIYSYDNNAILVEPIQNRTEKEIMRVFDMIHDYLQQRGLKPKYMRLDNE
eukprot:1564932-Ditylum_brightwellii.AAC.1